jgi:hypothetical protein
VPLRRQKQVRAAKVRGEFARPKRGTVHQLVAWLSSNTAALSILGAAIAFVWSTTQQVTQRKAEAREREFQAFHKLVKELSQPEDGKVWIERLCAVIFELRNFPLYYELTERMLVSLKKRLDTDTDPNWPGRLAIEEIDLTLKHIQQNNK